MKSPVFLAFIIGFFTYFGTNGYAQNRFIETEIRFISIKPARIAVSGEILNSRRDWRFTDSYAGVNGISNRLEKCEFFDETNKSISAKKFAFGAFAAEKEAKKWRCEVNVEPLVNFQAMAHLSHLNEERGLLMLNDLFPQIAVSDGEKTAAKIKFAIPAGWRVSSGEKAGANELEFITDDAENAVFLVGKDWREVKTTIGAANFTLVTAKERAFSDAEAIETARQILIEHQQTFGKFPTNEMRLIYLPFPRFVGANRWQAETRHTTTVLISGEFLTKGAALNLLHEQLRHEFFHFWVPNGVNLSGSYDWFYEGFTIYQALRVGLKTKTIRFEGYLNTLGQAFDATDGGNNEISLLEASAKRFQGNDLAVYGKGMTVAFLCDLAILQEGKRPFEDIFRELYTKHGANSPRTDGNAAVLKILKNFSPKVREIVEKYVEKPAKIEWNQHLNEVGLTAENVSGFTKLQISDKLNGRKKDLLKKLSYNSVQR